MLLYKNWDTIKAKATQLWNAITTTFNNIKTSITNVWENVKTATINAWNNIKTALTNIWEAIKNTAVNAWNSLKQAVINLCNNIKQGILNIWNAILSWFSQLPSKLYTHGANMFSRMRDGVSSKIGNVKSAIVNGINNTNKDIEQIAYELEFYRQRVSLGKGGV